MTIKKTLAKLKQLGCKARWSSDWQEYRVTLPNLSADREEAIAYYTSDPFDAVLTGAEMIRMAEASMNVHEYTAPSHWACYLINGDCSGLDAFDKRACDNWTKTLEGPVVSCTGVYDDNHAGFMRWHDAASFAPYTANCAVYTVLEIEA